jgi:hypothetical protein
MKSKLPFGFGTLFLKFQLSVHLFLTNTQSKFSRIEHFIPSLHVVLI